MAKIYRLGVTKVFREFKIEINRSVGLSNISDDSWKKIDRINRK